MEHIQLRPAQGLYEIRRGDVVSFLGFDHVRDHVQYIAQRLLHAQQAPWAWTVGDHGAVSGYEKYRQAVAAWGQSRWTDTTFFGPGVDPRVALCLEACRLSGQPVRLILGNAATGQPWFCEHDVVGTIGRSLGPLKAPLLIAPGETCGPAVLCDCIVAIVDWGTGDVLYRHADYRAPELRIEPLDEGEGWAVRHGAETIAAFDDLGRAGCYVAFMRGATIEPRLFATTSMSEAAR